MAIGSAAIQYSNVGLSGHYNRITAMNPDGTCHSVPQAFSGPISPLDREVGFPTDFDRTSAPG